MRRRKNFLLGGSAQYEVHVYHFGKSHARGDRNVSTKRFRDVAAAMRWAQANLDYPEVEVVDSKSGKILFSGGTGRKFNPRKKRKAPKRRDVYAEMAKARKTTKGHKRKDRRRAVRKGSSRKAKHKMRFNPPKDHEQATAETKIKNMFRRWSSDLAQQGVPRDMIPSVHDKAVGKQIKKSAEVLVASQHPELRSKAMEGTPGVEVAQHILQLKPGGVFHKFQKKYGDVFTEGTMEVAELVEKGRKGVAKAQKADAKQVAKAKKAAAKAEADKKAAKLKAMEARAAQLEAELEDDEAMPSDVAAELAEEFDDAEREVALAKAPEPVEEEYEDEYEPPEFLQEKRPSSQKRAERLGKYSDFLTSVRSSVRAPLEMLGETREGLLLYRLKDGTTQVYAKGALTVSFEPSAKLSSETIAHRYANQWRGLKPSGAVRDDAKKRRLAAPVYMAVEGRSAVKMIEQPIALVKRGGKKVDRKEYPMPDLDSYELKGPRANPRSRRRKNPKFGVGDRVKLSATALRLFKGRDYKDSRGKPYDKSYVGFIKHIEGNGYWVRRPGRPHTDLDYFREVDLAAAGSSPKRRKNSSVRYRVMYASVDGAGYYKKEGEPRTWATKEAAIRFADSKQENSDKSGNPYGYYYSVHTDTYPSRVVYRTR